MKQSIYETITQKIIAKLEEGVVPWRASWHGVGLPVNWATKKSYRGINAFVLFLAGYNSPYWMTFRQICSLGGSVKKGEKAMPVVFWKYLEKEDPELGERKRYPIIRHYNVFNELQCEGLNLSRPERKVSGIKACEEIKDGYLKRESNLTLTDTKATPFYLPKNDTVNVPPIGSFSTAEHYYTTLFHELIHSTGHSSRLDRGLGKSAKYGTEHYSKEELIAELGASFLSGITGIEPQVIDDSASYIDGWIKILKGDSKLLVQSGSKAQAAVDYILGKENQSEEKEEESISKKD